jgi:hypothetical protein
MASPTEIHGFPPTVQHRLLTSLLAADMLCLPAGTRAHESCTRGPISDQDAEPKSLPCFALLQRMHSFCCFCYSFRLFPSSGWSGRWLHFFDRARGAFSHPNVGCHLSRCRSFVHRITHYQAFAQFHLHPSFIMSLSPLLTPPLLRLSAAHSCIIYTYCFTLASLPPPSMGERRSDESGFTNFFRGCGVPLLPPQAESAANFSACNALRS